MGIDYNQTNYKGEIEKGVMTAFLNQGSDSNQTFKPEFLSNDHHKGKKVVASLEQELLDCEEFMISVAFITKSGITPLLEALKELEQKGIPGKILTTDYLCFSDPDAIETLHNLKNIEIRMFCTDDVTGGFHTKGYIFRKKDIYKIIIGSSNMTLNAITKNREWNTKIVSTKDGEMAQAVLGEFEELWSDDHSRSYEDFIESYREYFNQEKEKRKNQRKEEKIEEVKYDPNLKPNKMQEEFVENLVNLTESGEDKAMLLSPTGTGKSYASAFAVRELEARKMLFVVHREQIAKQAMKSYKKIFGKNKTFGLISGSKREMNADFVFSTMQMMSKSEIHKKYNKDYFDVIVLDECHHTGAESYQKIMNYFEPKLWLGMTASPDTNQYDIYSIFDNNIAYEIRLGQAMEEDFLCPFHYFGIADLEIDGRVIDDESELRDFSLLVSDQRVKHVIDMAEFYGHSGDRVKGLIFCSRKEEARELSSKFNQYKKKDGTYYKTEVLTGEDSQEHREEVCNRLVGDAVDGVSIDNQLDYIFTVDIFNEGVDLPELNQVIMLRPTQSPVIFIQQLGRGLRKADGKEYVVILDFIGNYTNNFMIPIALSEDRSYDKDTIRKYVHDGTRVIPGSSTIHFDQISRKRIYESIDKAKTNDMKLLRESYTSLKYKLGRIPTILEFKQYGSIDVTKIFSKCGSYHNFLKKYEKEYFIELNKKEEQIIEYISSKLVSYKRIHEIAMLSYLMAQPGRVAYSFDDFMPKDYKHKVSKTIEESVYRNLTNEFPKDTDKINFKDCVLIERIQKGNTFNYSLAPEFEKMLVNIEFKSMIEELLLFGEKTWEEKYSDTYKDTDLVLYKKYTYEDMCRLLGWKNNMNAQIISGYFYEKETKTLPVFINYDKTEDAIAYEDRFISEDKLIALSKHPRKVDSSDADHIYKRKQEDKDNRIFLFVRKNKDDKEAKEFYFLGEIFAEGNPEAISMQKTNDDAFEIFYKLDVPVRGDVYDYIVNE